MTTTYSATMDDLAVELLPRLLSEDLVAVYMAVREEQLCPSCAIKREVDGKIVVDRLCPGFVSARLSWQRVLRDDLSDGDIFTDAHMMTHLMVVGAKGPHPLRVDLEPASTHRLITSSWHFDWVGFGPELWRLVVEAPSLK